MQKILNQIINHLTYKIFLLRRKDDVLRFSIFINIQVLILKINQRKMLIFKPIYEIIAQNL